MSIGIVLLVGMALGVQGWLAWSDRKGPVQLTAEQVRSMAEKIIVPLVRDALREGMIPRGDIASHP